ncbi:hypothetical protein GCM10008985_19030 [Halococcus dombrowskii]|uniref:Secreted protein n=1 Tax=Halococcus dombrowskii TaxID=179637 RepID=A0AAV3SH08_HALDO
MVSDVSVAVVAVVDVSLEPTVVAFAIVSVGVSDSRMTVGVAVDSSSFLARLEHPADTTNITRRTVPTDRFMPHQHVTGI